MISSTLVDLFEAQAARTPHAVALSSERMELSYADLDLAARRVAFALRGLGVLPGDRVGVCLPRSAEAVIVVIAVLKLGAAYVPIPVAEDERRDLILSDADPRVVITIDGSRIGGGDHQRTTIAARSLLDASWDAGSTFPRAELTSDGIAWVIYTSGSTGKPKGVLGPHRGCVNRIAWIYDTFPIAPDEVCLQNTALTTVDSFWEIFAPLGCGATLKIFEDALVRDIDRLIPELARHPIRRICLVPSLLSTILSVHPDLGRKAPNLTLWVASGEALSSDLCGRFYQAAPDAVLMNQYGMTESCADISYFDTRRIRNIDCPGGAVPIGEALPGIDLVVLDHDFRTVADGVEAELFVGGECLAAGYLNRQAETRARFLELPTPSGFRRLYRTGDRVVRRENALLVFLGRLDRQVKIRGFRVELDEVEAVLSTCPNVRHCAVLHTDAGGAGKDRIEAWIEASPETADGLTEAVKQHALHSLPSHMRPLDYHVVSVMPLTASGKIDRKAVLALPASTTSRPARIGGEERDATLVWLRETFSGFLGQAVGDDEDFFELGGDSLLAIQLVARVRREYRKDLTLQAFFESPTIKALAASIDADEQISDNSIFPQITASPIKPCSYVQERLAILDRLNDGVPLFNVVYTTRLRGNLDIAALILAVKTVIGRHELFAGRVLCGADGAQQVFGDPPEVVVSDLRASTAVAATDQLAVGLSRLRERQFDLASEPPLRAALFEMSSSEAVLSLVLHQSVVDDRTVLLLGEQIEAAYAYATVVSGREDPWRAPAVVYADYAAWQRTLPATIFASMAEFWERVLDGAPPSLQLPTDFPRPLRPSYKGARHEIRLSAELMRSLKSFAEKSRATTYMALLAAFQAMLHRYSGARDIVVGTPVANRRHEATEAMVGCFMNTIPLRSIVDDATTFEILLGQVRQTVAGCLANQDLPFDKILEASRTERIDGVEPIFQVMFAQRLSGSLPIQLDGIESEAIESPLKVTQFDLTAWVEERNQEAVVQFDYAVDLFDARTIERLARGFVKLLEGALVEPDKPLAMLEMMAPVDRDLLLNRWQGPRRDRGGHTIIERIRRSFETFGPRPAVSFKGQTLTYGALAARVSDLSTRLRAAGVGGGDLVAVAIARSPDMVVAILSILDTGAAFLPLDLDHPKDRNRFILKDACPLGILSDEPSPGEFAEGVPVLWLDATSPWPTVRSGHGGIGAPVSSVDPCYSIYTSGSTGHPKGVQVHHGGLINLLEDMHERLSFQPSDVLPAITTISFDISILELLLPLIGGGEVALLSRDVVTDPHAIVAALEDRGATLLQATPSTWRMILATDWRPPARFRAICGGEPLDPRLAREMTSRCGRVYNVYGPTETTIWSTATSLDEGAAVTIGRPIANTRAYVVNDALSLTPIGAVGELLIGGAGVATGYKGRDDLTAARFLPDPFSAEPGARVYRTGDLVRYRPDGTLEYVRRTDDQVKIRGHRVEIGEIETVLRDCHGVADAGVCVVDGRLSAHVALADDAADELDFSLFFFAASEQTTKTDPYRLCLEAAEYGDRAGLTAIWTPERHFHAVGGAYPNPSILSAAIASITKRIAIRAGSVVLPLHNPVRVAEEWSVVDNLSNGRVGVAFASGWNPRDFIFFPDRYAQRRAILPEMTETVRRLWRGETVALVDGAGRERRVGIFPRPVQSELPVWITAAGPADTFAAAGRIGANVLTHLLSQNTEELAEKIKLYRRARADGGFDPGKVTVMVHAFVAETTSTAVRTAREPFLDYLRAHLSLDSKAAKDVEGISDSRDREAIIEAAWRRHCANALIGSVEDAVTAVKKLRRIGVGEIACLIDFGIATDEVIAALPALSQVQEQTRRLVQFDEAAALREMRLKLPEYMIPNEITVHDALPRTLNGKIDRRKLAELKIAPRHSQTPGRRPVRPTEVKLGEMWHAALGTEIIDVTTSFFAAGGHSLTAARLILSIRRHFSVDVPIRSIFDYPTIETFAAYLDTALPSKVEDDAIPARRDDNPHVASFAQERLVFLQDVVANKALYNTTSAWRINGDLCLTSLAAAFDKLLQRHPLLGSAARPGASGVDLFEVELPFRFRQSRRTDDEIAAIRDEAAKPFDLQRERPIRAVVFRQGADEFLFVVTVHHSVSDGWSIGLLNRDLSDLYRSAATGSAEALPSIPIRYVDFAAWQRRTMHGDRLAEGLAYWKETLRDLPDRLDLPTDRARPPEPTYAGATRRFRISAARATRLKSFALSENATLFMVLLSSFNVLLSRYTNMDDIAVGSPVVVRPPGTENMVGLFLNTLVLRVRQDPEMSARDLLRQVRDVCLGAYKNQDVPFEQIVEHLNVRRDLSRHPLFQAMLVLRNIEEDTLRFDGLDVSAVDIEPETAKFDLTLWAEDTPEGLDLGFEWALDLFDREKVEAMSRHFVLIAEQLAENVDRRLSDISLLDADDEARHRALEAKNRRALDPDATVHGLFERQAAKTPSHVAVITAEASFSYRWLSHRSDVIASHLLDLEIEPGDRVGVFLERGQDLVAALLGILKTGAAYLPLDPAYPEARTAYVCEDADAKAILVHGATRARLPASSNSLVVDLDTITPESGSPPRVSPGDDGLSHLIYTSGSTGQPKGVEITHRNTTAMLQWALLRFSGDELARVLAATSVCFDLSVFEIFAPLAAGGAVVMTRNFLHFADHPARDEVTLCNTVPSAMDAFLNARALPPSVRVVNLAGEALTRALCDRVYSNSGVEKLYNLYGPSECTTYSLEYLVPRDGRLEPLIGSPITNSTVRILDSSGALTPTGVVGELFIGGAGVAKGYRGRPELDAERFLSDPFSSEAGARIYATGDLVRRLPSGEIEFLGRRDRQIKLHGFRIELGEIESALRDHADVGHGVVLLRGNGHAPELVAYVTATGAPLDVADLRIHLQARLPAIMVPKRIMVLDAMPLTPNQKIDIKALPEFEIADTVPRLLVPPKGELEIALVEIWRDILRAEEFGVTDSFFEVGGNSLLVMQLRHRIATMCGRDLSTIDLFRFPTIRALATFMAAPVSSPVPDTHGRSQRIALQRRSYRRRVAGSGGIDGS